MKRYRINFNMSYTVYTVAENEDEAKLLAIDEIIEEITKNPSYYCDFDIEEV